MRISRRNLLLTGAAASAVRPSASASELGDKLARAMQTPVLRKEHFSAPVKIDSLDLLRSGAYWIVRARSSDGATGYAAAHTNMNVTYPIFLERVKPTFIG